MPSYYVGVMEMGALLTAEQSTIDELKAELDQANDNVFVALANSDGLKVFEKALGIQSVGSLESRRMKVLMAILPAKSLTLRNLRETIKLLGINATLSINYDARKVDVQANSSDADAINRLNYILHTWLPANMSFTSMNIVTANMSGLTYDGTASSMAKSIQHNEEG
jgi:hypothetical protein